MSRAQLHFSYLLPSQQMWVHHLQKHPDHYSGQVCLILEKAELHIIVLVNIRVSIFRHILSWRNLKNNIIGIRNCISTRIMWYKNKDWGIYR